MIGASAAAATAATVVRPFRAEAQETFTCQPGQTPCGQESCCPAGLICADANTGRCGCDPSIRTFCGDGCCNKKDTCSDPETVTCCCKGDTPCGTSCCRKGVACIDQANGLCGCPAGSTPCGAGASLRCCPAGSACTGDQEQPGCSAATFGPGQGPGYATPCSSTCVPCDQNLCPFGPAHCVNGCCTCVQPCDENCTTACTEGPVNCCIQFG